VRLGLEFLVAAVVVIGLYRYVEIDGHLVVPMIPLKWWYPYLPRYLFIPFMVIIIVAGANAVNLTDGMDSLATVPILTCTVFVAAVLYVGSDPDLFQRLKVPPLPADLKELVVLSAAVTSAGLAFLRFNAPPAMITMGDLGALALGSMISAMFIFAKAELFLPLVGGVFVLTTISTIIQRLFFKLMLARKGRPAAEKRRFFYRAPYHHHLQALWTYSEQERAVQSVWVEWLRRLGIRPPGVEDQLLRTGDVDSRVVWRVHMMSIWLLVFSLVVYFKVR
jgi:phospho-N-acetylmuramoyl-pentapeptide-transferase